jgi:phospholipid/cholesterol/gamma-HCH transport system permease protein
MGSGNAMTGEPGWIREEKSDARTVLSAGGAWTVAAAPKLEAQLAALTPAGRDTAFDLSEMETLDTAGAWLLRQAAERYEAAGARVSWQGMADRFRPLFDLVEENEGKEPERSRRPNALVAALERLGGTTVEAGRETVALTAFIGQASVTAARALLRPKRFRLVSLANQIEQTGLNAMPIVGLMAFLIGVVLAYQGAIQLRKFGAEVYTIDMLAITIPREIGVLLTAIMVAGRSGSAFTAQIGTMKVNEEIAAMQALGLDPMEILVLPRINALVVTLPILTLFSIFVGMVGGAAMAIVSLDMAATQFVDQLQKSMTLSHFVVGMVKAPVFAYLIAVVGCYQGLRVSGGAESVGRLTTRSVVLSIFLVIVADAVFSIMFAWMGV